MRITVLLLLAASLHVSATGLSQKVRLGVKNEPLEKVFSLLKKQTGYFFFYSYKELEQAHPVTLNVKDAPLTQVLQLLFHDQPLTYTIDDNTVVINQKSFNPLPPEVLSPPADIHGKVLNEKGEPLAGAFVKLVGGNRGVLTDEKGAFTIANADAATAVLEVSFISYEKKQLALKGKTELNIILNPDINNLQATGVQVVSTGYQDIARERVTGSFVKVDNELINRSVTTNILDRLEGVTSGLIFNRQPGARDAISIRGRSTIFSDAEPLIIVDGFSYEGDITNINPNDVESITVLKDAAAASIWGARAGNGVIVVTTKKGHYNQKAKISVSGNLTVGEKPDLFQQSLISTSDFIDLDRKFFDLGYYNSYETSPGKPALNPLVEILIKKRDHLITDKEAEDQINALRNIDVRTDLTQYMMRRSVNQQHALNISGGADKMNYLFSAGYDKNLPVNPATAYTRTTLMLKNTFTPISKLEIATQFNYTQTKNKRSDIDYNNVGGSGSGYNVYPYARLKDDQGNPLALDYGYRKGYVDTVGGGRLLDWHYVPLNEMNYSNDVSKMVDTRLNLELAYKPLNALSMQVKYQYLRSSSTSRNLDDINTYYARNMINKFTQRGAGDILSYPVPIGGIININNRELESHAVRAQANYNKTWNNIHQLTALAGTELNQAVARSNSSTLYGYSEEYATNITPPYEQEFSDYTNPFSSYQILDFSGVSGTTDRFVSYYANAAYTFKSRYTVTASGRKDASNLFGVRTNQKGVPLWSAGLGWNISNESFYHWQALPAVKLRLTYGFNGNVDRGATSLLTTYMTSATYIPATAADITNTPNPDLRWERVKVVNIGLDFSTRNNVLSGTIEYYSKKGLDLMGKALVPPSSGTWAMQLRRNVAASEGHGWDLTLNSRNLRGSFNWETNFLLSYVTGKVTQYLENAAPYQYVREGNGSGTWVLPRVDKPIFSIYSFRSAGLDPNTGDPRAYLDGKISSDYTKIANTNSFNDIVYNGSATPTVFGSLRNSFSWKALSLSFNLTYKLGYYFKRQSFSGWYGTGQRPPGDYAQRWQKPGDEAFTQVPSQIYSLTVNTNRSFVYSGSDQLVVSGNHLRWQDLRIGYDFASVKNMHLPFRQAQLFLYASNLGIIWRANKYNLDPDSYRIPQPRTVAMGVKLDF